MQYATAAGCSLQLTIHLDRSQRPLCEPESWHVHAVLTCHIKPILPTLLTHALQDLGCQCHQVSHTAWPEVQLSACWRLWWPFDQPSAQGVQPAVPGAPACCAVLCSSGPACCAQGVQCCHDVQQARHCHLCGCCSQGLGTAWAAEAAVSVHIVGQWQHAALVPAGTLAHCFCCIVQEAGRTRMLGVCTMAVARIFGAIVGLGLA